jgi:hypothetical protein
MLKEHKTNHPQTGQHMNNQNDNLHQTHINYPQINLLTTFQKLRKKPQANQAHAAAEIAKNSFATYDAPPIRPPSISDWAKI